MRRSISLVNLLVMLSILLLVSILGVVSLFAYRSITVVIDTTQEQLYLERSENIASMILRKFERLQQTGIPEAYEEDFQKQIISEINVVYRVSSESSSLNIVDRTGRTLLSSGSFFPIDSLLISNFNDSSDNSFNFSNSNGKWWVHTLYFEPWEWYVCYSIPITQKYSDRSSFFSIFVPVLIILLFIFAVISTSILKYVMRPVLSLTKATAAITNGESDVSIPHKGVGELAELALNFSYMRDSINSQMATLKSQELDLRTTIESISDAIITTDGEGKILRVNTASQLFLGKNNLIGSSIEVVVPIHDTTFVEHSMESFIQNGRSFTLSPEATLAVKTDPIHVSGIGSPMADEFGNVIGFVLVFRDVSKDILLREQLHQSQKMEAIGQLAGGVAHDFNNMLAGILGAVELLKDDCCEEDKNEYLDLILKTTERAGYLTRQLLAFSRKGTKVSSKIDIASVVLETVNLLKRTLDKSIKISFNNNSEISTIIGDNTLLQNALMNIGINASHAMPNGGSLTFLMNTISLDSDYCSESVFDIAPGKYIEISVRDTGLGMTPEVQKRIFEPFFTTKKQGKGTGLGLAATYGMVQEHSGEISVSSELNVGTVFKIYLPRVVTSEDIHNSDKSEPARSGVGTILVVEDEELLRITAGALLKSLGYTVIFAENGALGVEMFIENQNEIDLIITDMIMPVMGGRELVNNIRGMSTKVPIIISSGFSHDGDLKNMDDFGITGFLHKPYRKSTLSELVEKAMLSIKNS